MLMSKAFSMCSAISGNSAPRRERTPINLLSSSSDAFFGFTPLA